MKIINVPYLPWSLSIVTGANRRGSESSYRLPEHGLKGNVYERFSPNQRPSCRNRWRTALWEFNNGNASAYGKRIFIAVNSKNDVKFKQLLKNKR